MSESSDTSPEPDDRRESSEPGAIDDADLPEDLQPEKNPLARDPDDQDEGASVDPQGDAAGG